MDTDKDNFMVALKWAEINKMMFYNRQQIAFEYETDWGLKATLIGKLEENESCGHMTFTTLDQPLPTEFKKTGNGDFMRTTEVSAKLRYAPGETATATSCVPQRLVPSCAMLLARPTSITNCVVV